MVFVPSGPTCSSPTDSRRSSASTAARPMPNSTVRPMACSSGGSSPATRSFFQTSAGATPLQWRCPLRYSPWGSFRNGSAGRREAARAYKRLLVADAPEDTRARAAWGLARAYESQKLWTPARAAYLQAAGRFGQAMVDGEGADGRLADAVAARLARAPFDRMPLESPEPPLGLPLRRRWEARWPATIRPLAADGTPPSADQGRIFLVEGTTLRAVDPRTGKPSWSANLGSEPVWAGYLADRLVAASRTKIMALERGQGAIEWQYDPSAPSVKAATGPFAKGEGADPAREQGSAQLQDFRVVGGRVVCLRGDQAIVAIDGETGQVDWTYAPSVGRINPRLLAGPERIVLQVPQAERGVRPRHGDGPPPRGVPAGGRRRGMGPRPAANRRRPRGTRTRPADGRPVRLASREKRLVVPRERRASQARSAPARR